MHRLLILPFLLVFSGANAQAYKCVVDGKTTYQSSPCAGAGSTVDTRPASEGVTGLRKDADSLAAREKREAQTVPAKPRPVSDCIVVGKGPFIKCEVLK